MSQIQQHRQQKRQWFEEILNDKTNPLIKLETKYQWIPFCNRNLFIKCEPQIHRETPYKMNVFIKYYFASKDFKRWTTLPLLSSVSVSSYIVWSSGDQGDDFSARLKIKKNKEKIESEQRIFVGTIHHQTKRININITLQPPDFVYHHK